MNASEDNLIADWDHLIGPPPTPPTVPRSYQDSMAVVAARLNVDRDLLSDVLWQEIRKLGLEGYLVWMLDSADLSVEELTGIVQGLPEKVLERMLESVIGKRAAGVHGVIMLEARRRLYQKNYTLSRDSLGILQATFVLEEGSPPMTISLTSEADVPSRL